LTEHKALEYLAINYSGTLPVLSLDDGTLIDEYTALIEYRDDLDELTTLTGTLAREKGLIHKMSRCAELELLDASSVYFRHATPRHATPRLGAHVELYQNSGWGIRQRVARRCGGCAISTASSVSNPSLSAV
jgi:glutathione S-transferase